MLRELELRNVKVYDRISKIFLLFLLIFLFNVVPPKNVITIVPSCGRAKGLLHPKFMDRLEFGTLCFK